MEFVYAVSDTASYALILNQNTCRQLLECC